MSASSSPSSADAPETVNPLAAHPLPPLPSDLQLDLQLFSSSDYPNEAIEHNLDNETTVSPPPPPVPVHVQAVNRNPTYAPFVSSPLARTAMSHVNGVNGSGLSLPGMMSGIPTPAGHQQDLNHISTLLDEYAKMMEENRKLTARVMDGVGRVRERAGGRELTGDDVVNGSSKELNGTCEGSFTITLYLIHCLDTTKTLEGELSYLRKKYETAQIDADEYAQIALSYAKAMGEWLERIHAFKLKNTEDVSAWHTSYRDQLAHERAENLRLSNQILLMNEAAARANNAINKFKEGWSGTPRYYEEMAEKVKYRQLCRMYKRMALPELDDDDSEFSDDDDMIDPEEKKRIAAEAVAKIRRRKAKEEAEVTAQKKYLGVEMDDDDEEDEEIEDEHESMTSSMIGGVL